MPGVVYNARSCIQCPEFYTMPGVLYNARSSILWPKFYTMPGVLYNARSSIQCLEFYAKPGDFYTMPRVLCKTRRFLYNVRSSIQCQESLYKTRSSIQYPEISIQCPEFYTMPRNRSAVISTESIYWAPIGLISEKINSLNSPFKVTPSMKSSRKATQKLARSYIIICWVRRGGRGKLTK